MMPLPATLISWGQAFGVPFHPYKPYFPIPTLTTA